MERKGTHDIETAAQMLVGHPDYRVLRRITSEWPFAPALPVGTHSIGAAIDVETTGLDHANDQVIELAVQRFRYDGAGRITEIGVPRSWRNDPGKPLDPQITKLTGLSDADLGGQRIDLDLVASVLASTDIIVAHNASFDRPFLDHLVPIIRDKPWGCTITDIDWLELGFEGRSLSHLLMQSGWFFEAHRAANDVLALLYLLAQVVRNDKTVLALLLETLAEPVTEIVAIKAPYEARELLRKRGYRWSADLRAWRVEVKKTDVEPELAWLQAHVYEGENTPLVNPLGMHERHRGVSLPL